MKFKFLILLMALPLSVLADIEGKVVRILDGDTLDVLQEGNKISRIRLEDIDAPRHTAYQLARERTSETAYRHQIWKKSPAIKIVYPELKREAIKRMRERPASKELVKDIAADLNLSINRLYAWLKQGT